LLNKYTIFFLTVVTVTLLDQATKAFIHSTMSLYSSRVMIDGFLSITYVRNPGAAFGFLAQAPPFFRSVFFVLVTLLAIGMILYYLITSRADQPGLVLALSLIFSGALGNLIDRLRFGEVIDFIDVYFRSHHWPAFNVADSAISVGAMIMILEMVRHSKDDDKKE
jgi:signal peptidase II